MVTSRISSVMPSGHGEHDAAILREASTRLDDPAVRDAALVLAAGIESGGLLLARLDQMLTPQKAAELIGVSRQYIDKLITEKKLSASYKPGSTHRLIKATDLLAFEEERQVGSRRIGQTMNDLLEVGAEY